MAAVPPAARMIHAADYLQTLLWHLNTLHHGPRIHHLPHHRATGHPSIYYWDNVIRTKYTIYTIHIKYIGLQLDFQKWYYLLYLPNELKRIFGFVTKACFFRWNQKLIFSRSLVRALLPYYQLTSFDKHQFPITILNCSALYSYSRFKKLLQNFFSGTFSRAQKKT